MFEKEAEEWVKDYTIKSRDCILFPCRTLEDCQVQDFEFDEVVRVFKDGAEFGYNKANEWHYPSKGEYPKEAERYKPKWHKVADGDYPPLEVGNFTVDVLTDRGEIAYYAYDNECWVVEPSCAEIDPPIAWCEIPKFKEI